MSAVIFRGGRFLTESGKRIQVEEILGQTGTKAKGELADVPLFSGVKDDFFWSKLGELFKKYKATTVVFAPGVMRALFDLLANVKLPMTNAASEEVKLKTTDYDTARLLQMLERVNILIPRTMKADEVLKSGTVGKAEKAELQKNPDKSVIGYVLHKHFADRLGGLLRTFDIDVGAVPALAMATESNSRAGVMVEGWQDEDEIVNDLVEFFKDKEKITDEEKIAEMREEIKDSLDLNSGRYSDYGDCGKFTYDGTEYNLITDTNEAEKIAVDYVTATLEDEPELFNQDFLQEYVYVGDTDKRIIAGEEADSFMDGIDDDDAIKQADMEDEKDELETKVSDFDDEIERIDDEIASDEEELAQIKDDDSESMNKARVAINKTIAELKAKRTDIVTKQKVAKEVLDSMVDDAKEKIRDERYEYVYNFLDKDPMGYFVDELGAYTREEVLKQNLVSIDYDKAAKAAVDTDGWEHFLSLYDGNYDETNGGLVVFRED